MPDQSTPLERQRQALSQEEKTKDTCSATFVRPSHRMRSFFYQLGWAMVLCISLGALLILLIQSSQGITDYCQDYYAAKHLLHGELPYLPLRSLSGESICPGLGLYDSHPPFTVLLFLPLGLFPEIVSATVWGFVSLTVYLVSGLLLLQELGWRILRGMALFALGCLFWTPALLALNTHNVGQLVTALIVGAWVLERKKRYSWAGVLIGVAGLIKLWPIVLLVNGLIWRKGRYTMVAIVTFVGGLALSLFMLKPVAYLAYLGPVQAAERHEIPAKSNTSLVGDIARLFIGYPARPPMPPLIHGLSLSEADLFAEAIGVLLLGGTALFIWRCSRRIPRKTGELLAQGLLVVVLLLVFPVTWYWGLVTLILPCATTCLALRELPRPPAWWFMLLVLSLILLLVPSWILVDLPGWLLESQNPLLAWLANLLTWLPTCALLLFAGIQAQLLWRASRGIGRGGEENTA